jgi:hypothetical protein
MEKEKDANQDAKEMMNHIRELFPALDDEEVLEEKIYEDNYQEDSDEDPDETIDKEEVVTSALPFDEDIQGFVPLTHQEENMMSYNLFEDLDDTLFHDFGSDEVLEEPLDVTEISEKGKMKHSALRIKPRVMKR